MEPKILYRSAGILFGACSYHCRLTLSLVEQVPEDDFHLPIGKAEVLIPGSDVTVLAWGTPVYNAENAIEFLKNPPAAIESLVPPSLRSAKIELIDLRSILPWDVETVVESVKKTGRLVIVHEAGMTAGAGAEISAEVQKRCFLKLSAPVKRVTGWEYVSYLFHVMQLLISCVVVFPTLSNMKNFIYQTPFGFLMLSWRLYHTDSNTHHHFT